MALSSQQQTELAAWLALYTANSADLDARTALALAQVYGEVGDWFSPTLTLAAAAAAADTVRAGQDLQAGLMTQFISAVLDILGGVTLTRRVPTPAYPRNADPFRVYSRPVFRAREVLTREAAGAQDGTTALLERAPTSPAALLDAQQLAEVLAETDALLTRRDTALALFDDDQAAGIVTGYRRVIRPELSKTGVCGLCIAAATRVYKRGDLMPIHSRCKCTVLPVIDGEDPAARFNADDLDRIYSETAGTTRRDLSKTRYRVRDNNELGPVLEPAAKQAVPRTGDPDGGGGPTPQTPEASPGFSGGGSSLPPRRGMLGAEGDDDFPTFDGYQPPARRSQIDPFTELDAQILLDGDGTPDGHGYHRHGLGIKTSEFPAGWDETDVITWVRDIIDRPVWATAQRDGFILYGGTAGVLGMVKVRPVAGTPSWEIASAYPVREVQWPL